MLRELAFHSKNKFWKRKLYSNGDQTRRKTGWGFA